MSFPTSITYVIPILCLSIVVTECYLETNSMTEEHATVNTGGTESPTSPDVEAIATPSPMKKRNVIGVVTCLFTDKSGDTIYHSWAHDNDYGGALLKQLLPSDANIEVTTNIGSTMSDISRKEDLRRREMGIMMALKARLDADNNESKVKCEFKTKTRVIKLKQVTVRLFFDILNDFTVDYTKALSDIWMKWHNYHDSEVSTSPMADKVRRAMNAPTLTIQEMRKKVEQWKISKKELLEMYYAKKLKKYRQTSVARHIYH